MAKGSRGGQRGKSKAINLTLYHGSPSTDIVQFDDNHMATNTSTGERFIYFTNDINFADEFSYQRLDTNSMLFDKKGKKGNVYKSNVVMKNPLDFNNLSDKDIKNIVKMDEDNLLTYDDVKRYIKVGNHQLLKSQFDINKISKYGYDGFIAKVNKKGNSLEYGVLSSKQISNTSKYK